MWGVKIMVILLTAAMSAAAAGAQSLDHVLEFMGADAAEEVDPYEVERLQEFMEHPLKINISSISALEESGLFSHYQAASLKDYRSRHGDVLSFVELAAVDGFGQDFVSKLKPFISLVSSRLPGQPSATSCSNDISVRSGIRIGSDPTYGLKYRMTAGERLSAGISVSRTSSAGDMKPDAYSGHLTYNMKRFSGKILAGDFNARFGQGLALWNGLSLSGLNTSSSFMRKPSGISASSSFTGGYALRGIASDISVGRARISAMAAAAPEEDGLTLMPAANLSWFFRSGHLSFTHYADFLLSRNKTGIPDMKTSADCAFCIDGTDVFAETVYDWVTSKAAALAGLAAPVGENVRIASMLRYYPSEFTPSRSAAARSTTKCSNEYAASAAADISAGRWIAVNGAGGFGSSVRRVKGTVSADCAYSPEPKSDDSRKSMQIKLQTEWEIMLSGAFKAKVRLAERIRTWDEPFRTDIRTDLSYMSEHVLANLRLNALKSSGLGLLGYAEGGYRTGKLTVYLRQGIFRIDDWADRIYAYERDAPGSFNVPAYYGRGFWTALSLNWKFAGWGRMYIRAAATSYPFMAEKKPGRAELKFQFRFIL